MNVRWPWRRAAAADRVVIAGDVDHFVYAWSDPHGRLRRCGVEARGNEDAAGFRRRLKALGLPAQGGCAVLALEQAQLLQIDAPSVRPDELKAAARWRIKDQVEGRPDDYAIDVMVVGDERPRPNRQLFVAAARSEAVRATVEQARAAGLELAVVDIVETAQRNLQTEVANAAGLGSRATAALVRHGRQVLLTICAGGELYHARRLDWEPLSAATAEAHPAARAVAGMGFEDADFVDYGAVDGADATAAVDDAPRLVIELQRSFDLWERSWPDLPLATLWVQVGDDSAALAARLAATLGQQVGVLDVAAALPDFAQVAGTPELRAAVLPIVGALFRRETRRL